MIDDFDSDFSFDDPDCDRESGRSSVAVRIIDRESGRSSCLEDFPNPEQRKSTCHLGDMSPTSSCGSTAFPADSPTNCSDLDEPIAFFPNNPYRPTSDGHQQTEDLLICPSDPSYRVERYHYTELSVEDFRRKICSSNFRNPIIIEGMGDLVLNREQNEAAGGADNVLSIDFLKRNVRPNLMVNVRMVDGSEKDATMQEFWEEFDACEEVYQGETDANGVYLKDAAIATHYPWLFQEHVRIPAYFLHCFKHRTRNATLNGSAYVHPSIFLGNSGTTTRLHIDPWPTNFWTYQVEGRKKWTVYHPDDQWMLGAEETHEEPVVHFPKNAEQLERERADGQTPVPRRLSFILRPGEVMFNPAETPHEVINLDKTLAVVALFLDQSNTERCLTHLGDIIAKMQHALDGAKKAETEKKAPTTDSSPQPLVPKQEVAAASPQQDKTPQLDGRQFSSTSSAGGAFGRRSRRSVYSEAADDIDLEEAVEPRFSEHGAVDPERLNWRSRGSRASSYSMNLRDSSFSATSTLNAPTNVTGNVSRHESSSSTIAALGSVGSVVDGGTGGNSNPARNMSSVSASTTTTVAVVPTAGAAAPPVEETGTPAPTSSPYAALLTTEQLEFRLFRRKDMLFALDEIEFPEVDEDLRFHESLVELPGDMVGLFKLHDGMKWDEKTRMVEKK